MTDDREREYQSQEYDEISLKELILAIWNERKLVLLIFVLTVALTGAFTFGYQKPQYETTSALMMKELSEVSTVYGTYAFPSANFGDYTQYIYSNDVIDRIIERYELDTTREGFKKSISINQEKESNRVEIIVTSVDPELAYQINRDLAEQYVESLRIEYKRTALDDFIAVYQRDIESYQNSIEYEEAVLEEARELLQEITPIYTLQKLFFSDPEAAAIYAEQMNLDFAAISESVMSQEYINENYFTMESRVYDLEYKLVTLRETLEKKQRMLNELDEEKALIEQLAGTDSAAEILNGRLDVMASNIRISDYPNQPEHPVSPRVMLNMAIGSVLGLMMGVFVGLFRSYWKNS